MNLFKKLLDFVKSRFVVICISILALISFVLLGLYFVRSNSVENFTITRQADLVSLIKPSIVKVITSTTGTFLYPDFEFDPQTLDLKVIEPKKGKNKYTVDNDEAYGTGFIIDPSGYILTNAHVATIGMIKSGLLDYYDAAVQNLEDKLKTSKKPADRALYDKYSAYTESDWQKVKDKAWRVIWDNIDSSNVSQHIVVLNPNATTTDFEQQIDQGFEAKIVKANENFLFDDKDIAIIKIEKTNLPSITINDKIPVSEGERIIIAGYPSSADTGTSANKASITSGIVSSLKDSENIRFKYFEVDAKVAPGSSGSPVIDGAGRVIGVLTEQSNALYLAGSGDNFAYAIPISEAFDYYKDLVKTPALYEDSFRKGLAYYYNGNCALANENFLKAKAADADFISNGDVTAYLSTCENKALLSRIKDMGLIPFVISFIIISLLIATLWFWKKDIFLEAKLEEEQREIKEIEQYIKNEKQGDVSVSAGDIQKTQHE